MELLVLVFYLGEHAFCLFKVVFVKTTGQLEVPQHEVEIFVVFGFEQGGEAQVLVLFALQVEILANQGQDLPVFADKVVI